MLIYILAGLCLLFVSTTMYCLGKWKTEERNSTELYDELQTVRHDLDQAKNENMKMAKQHSKLVAKIVQQLLQDNYGEGPPGPMGMKGEPG